MGRSHHGPRDPRVAPPLVVSRTGRLPGRFRGRSANRILHSGPRSWRVSRAVGFATTVLACHGAAMAGMSRVRSALRRATTAFIAGATVALQLSGTVHL